MREGQVLVLNLPQDSRGLGLHFGEQPLEAIIDPSIRESPRVVVDLRRDIVRRPTLDGAVPEARDIQAS